MILECLCSKGWRIYQFDGAVVLLQDPHISEVPIEPIVNQSVGGTPSRIGWEGAMAVVRHTVR